MNGQRLKGSSFALTLAVLAASPLAAETHPFNALDLVSMARISDPRPSPDGSAVAYVLRTTDLEADKGRTDLWLAASDGSTAPRRLTTHEASDSSPRWAPDGRGIYFLSTRSGSSQVWYLPAAGGEARQVTDLPLDVGTVTVSPDGGRLAVTLEVFPDCPDLPCTVSRLEERAAAKSSARLYDHLFVRHWDTWKDGRRSHLFVVPADAASDAAPVDVTRGMVADVPPKPFGGDEEIAFTPDGQGLVFTARDGGPDEPWSTDFNLFLAPVDGSAAPRRLTDNPAWDAQPVFSPDGKTLAYLAMARPGYESDRFRIMLRPWPEGEPRALTEGWDRSPGGLAFAAGGRTLYATAGDVGNVALFAVDVASGAVTKLVGDGHVRSPRPLPGGRLVFGRDDLRSPVDLWVRQADGSLRRLTRANDERLAQLRLGDFEQFSFAGWNGETVYGYLVKPVDFDPGKRYPIAFLIHGGPQGSFDNDFHYRWNPQVYAGAGYAAIMIDFHGSTGYGQAFTDSIRGDWGGKPLEDLQKGLEHALASWSFLDGERICALGASYGGYMINWIAGNWQRFDCLVNHDGLFDLRDMYYTTEELWFPEWEMGGPYWQNPLGHEKHNPANHVDKWRTPMLVIHGALDYRVVDTQGLATFTALQRKGIPSRLLYFPDENHWVLKPGNSLRWHEVVLDWLERWTGP
ncbi:MAG: S9 family peptidase [Acidobacteria bacterium]|nr:MAG: S9 family peptidase [Acidobacteriota bacterium]